MKLDRNKMIKAMARMQMNFKDLAEKSGVSISTLNKIGKGGVTRPKAAGMIAAALGLDVEELLEEAGA